MTQAASVLPFLGCCGFEQRRDRSPADRHAHLAPKSLRDAVADLSAWGRFVRKNCAVAGIEFFMKFRSVKAEVQ